MSQVRPDEVSEILRKQLSGFEKASETYEVGTVLEVRGRNGIRSWRWNCPRVWFGKRPGW